MFPFICNYAKTTVFVVILAIHAKTHSLLQIANYAPNERIEGIFCACRKPANFCHPGYHSSEEKFPGHVW